MTINVKKSLPLGSFFDIKNIMTLTVKALTNSNVFATTISWAELGRFRALKLSILVMGSTLHPIMTNQSAALKPYVSN